MALRAYSRDVPGKAGEDDGSDSHDNEDNPERCISPCDLCFCDALTRMAMQLP